MRHGRRGFASVCRRLDVLIVHRLNPREKKHKNADMHGQAPFQWIRPIVASAHVDARTRVSHRRPRAGKKHIRRRIP